MKNKRFILFLLLVLLSVNQHLSGQNTAKKTKDSTEINLVPIELSEIPVRSSELKIKTKQEIQNLVSDDAIKRIKTENDQLISSIDRSLLRSVDPNDPSIGIRYLENRQIKFTQSLRKIAEQKIFLTEILHNIDSLKSNLLNEVQRWKYSQELLAKDSLTTAIPGILPETITFLDNSLLLISQKSHSVLDIIDKTIEVSVVLEAQAEKNKSLIHSKQKNVFRSDHPSIFGINYEINYKDEIRNLISHIINVDLVELTNYLASQSFALVMILFLFGGLVYLFVTIKKKVKISENGYGYFYKDMLLQVICHPVSASLVLCLFFSMLFFPDRPPIFRQVSFFVIAFPLINILRILLDRKYLMYINAYGVLVLLYILLILSPADFVFFRLLLLLIAIIEIVLLSIFLLYFEIKQEITKSRKRMIYFFILLHLGLAVTGLFSNIAGRLILTDVVLFAVFFNVFHGLSIFTTVLLLNGLISIGIDTATGQKLNVFRMNGELIKRKSIYILNAFGFFVWILLILKNFMLLETLYKGFISIFTYKIAIGSARFSLDGFVIFFVVVYISIVLSKIIRSILEEDVLTHFSLSKGLPHTIAMIVRYALITAGFFLAVNAAGIPLDKLTIIIGAMSVGIGFGLQNIFNNLVSGLILLFERPIQLGDTVQVGQLTGNVQTIGLRSSNVKTFDGAEVIVPNGQLVSNEVINWTLSDLKRRIEIKVQVAYHSDPKLVLQLLSNILNSHADVLQDPPPAVFFHEFGESSLDFILLFWIGDNNHARRIKSEILFTIFETLKENKIEIPFPRRDIFIRPTDQYGALISDEEN